MGMSVIWYSKTRPTSRPRFPTSTGAIEFNEDNVYYVRSGDWEWETGQYRNQAEETEYIRDYGMMAIFANWSFLKNHSQRKAEWARDTLSWVSPIGGKRESYRVVGDHVLTQNDIENHVVLPGCDRRSITWNLDLHFPDPETREASSRNRSARAPIIAPSSNPIRCRTAACTPRTSRICSWRGAYQRLACRVRRRPGDAHLGHAWRGGRHGRDGLRREKIYPRDIYPSRWKELQAMLDQGVPAPATYHPGGYGSKYEGYHFKDTGHLSVYPRPNEKLNDPKVQERIQALGVQHMK